MRHRFAGLGEEGRRVYLYEADRKTKARQILWGDWLNIEGAEQRGWLKVVWAPKSKSKRREYWIPAKDTIEKRPLEIVFVDVGQGDGAVLITPETGDDERIIVIDAGEGDNMLRFLRARFRGYRGFDFTAAVITHPDKDHYNGFRELFADQRLGFGTVYHNGLVERPVKGQWPKLGGLKKKSGSRQSWLTGLAEDRATIEKIYGDASKIGNFYFPQVMHNAVTNPKIRDFRMLSTRHGTIEDGKTYMPGFAPSDDRGYCIEVLGPVVETGPRGKAALRRIGSYGETKNGHSVLLRLVYGDFTIFFGGDLNYKAEKFLLTHYAGIGAFPIAGTAEYEAMVADAGRRFRSDVMKVCHHGSEKVTDAFLQAVHPAAFIISSGDEEGHVHPRPDLLGRLGRLGRGTSPVILATELQRSTREREDQRLVEELGKSIDKLALRPGSALRRKIQDQIDRLSRGNVSVYGAIYVKTDGERLIAAFQIESGSKLKKWFYFEYRFTGAGELLLVQ